MITLTCLYDEYEATANSQISIKTGNGLMASLAPSIGKNLLAVNKCNVNNIYNRQIILPSDMARLAVNQGYANC